MGIGVPDVQEIWKWYREMFGVDIRLFEDAAEAPLMTRYTGGEVHSRTATLALSMESGGGFEIWQYTSRTPEAPKFDIKLGDLGFFAGKMKSRDVATSFQQLKAKGVEMVSDLNHRPDGSPHFFVKDPYGNVFEIVSSSDWFKKDKHFIGGAYGAIIGVSDIEKARVLYSEILGYDEVVYDETGRFDDLNALNGGSDTFRRILLKHSKPRIGAFSKMLGASELELVQVQNRAPRKIFEGRLWGDLGFIHLCYDIAGMDELRNLCESKGFPFTVDSKKSLAGKFDMGEAAGNFSYIEDPDGTLIEFVETLKVPILKKVGWYLNLQKRPPEKALPTWMLRAMALNRVK